MREDVGRDRRVGALVAMHRLYRLGRELEGVALVCTTIARASVVGRVKWQDEADENGGVRVALAVLVECRKRLGDLVA